MSKLPEVTDHCVLRYLERVMGYDIKAVRQRIAEECRSATIHRAPTIKTNGHKYQIQHGNGYARVVTVEPKGLFPSRTRQAQVMGTKK